MRITSMKLVRFIGFNVLRIIDISIKIPCDIMDIKSSKLIISEA